MKKPIDNACFFTFFTTLDLIWSQDHIYFDIFADFQLILITLIGILYFRKKRN